jgi:hypothetical protein
MLKDTERLRLARGITDCGDQTPSPELVRTDSGGGGP